MLKFGKLTLTLLGCLVLLLLVHSVLRGIDLSRDRCETVVLVAHLESYYMAFISCTLFLVYQFLGSMGLQFRKLLLWVGVGGAVVPVVLFRILGDSLLAKNFALNSWIQLAFEVSKLPGVQLLQIMGRPGDLTHSHFELWFEVEQFLFFLPGNSMGWILLSGLTVVVWRFARRLSSRKK